MKLRIHTIYLIILFSLTISNCYAKNLIIDEEKSKLTYSLSEFGFVFKRKPLPMKGFIDVDKNSLKKIDMTVRFTSKSSFFRKFINYDKYPDFTFVSKNNEPIDLKNKTFKISGDVTFHGVTKNIEVELLNNSDDENFFFSGNLDMKMTDFDLIPPRFLFFRIDDLIKTEVEIYSSKV